MKLPEQNNRTKRIEGDGNCVISKSFYKTITQNTNPGYVGTAFSCSIENNV